MEVASVKTTKKVAPTRITSTCTKKQLFVKLLQVSLELLHILIFVNNKFKPHVDVKGIYFVN